jgi:hypothetical protein
MINLITTLLTTNLVLIPLLLIAAGHFKGRLDAIADEGVKSLDWPKKYNFTKPFITKHWWYFNLYTPKYPERFPFSSTALVFLTDRWHYNQFLMLRCFYLSIAFMMPFSFIYQLIIAFAIMPVLVGLSFEVSYNKYRDRIQNKKYNKYDVTGDEPYESQVTSVPEKQIND